MLSGSVATVCYGNVELELHAQKCAWHRASRTLFLADLHLGKETSFQRAGLPVPLGATHQALQRIKQLIAMYQPERVVVLGDMVHASNSFSENFRTQMQAFWAEQLSNSPAQEWILVEGNHDRLAMRELRSWPITVVQPPWVAGDFICVHDPDTEIELNPHSPHALILAGHLHPSFRMPDNGEKLCCFGLRGNTLVFPAFNEFTGRVALEIGSFTSVFVIKGDDLSRIDLKEIWVERP